MTKLLLDGTEAASPVNYETRQACRSVKKSLIFFQFSAMLNSWAANKPAQPVTP